MRKTLLILILFISFHGYSQKLRVSNGSMLIDTLITLSGPSDKGAYTTIKKWIILNLPAGSVVGEVEDEVIRVNYITDYWAAGGVRQKYKQDLIFSFDERQVDISIKNLYTHVEGKKGWSADKFFVDREGMLKPGFRKFYDDVERKFRLLVDGITE